MRRTALAMSAAALVPLALLSPPSLAASDTVSARPQTGLRIVPLTITTATGPLHYQIEVAATRQQQAIGMMFRRDVPVGTGMIFPLDPPRQASFWMRNTLIPLDLLFIGTDGRIRNIIEQAVPQSEVPLESLGTVAAVLELAGGEAARAGIRPGDKVSWQAADRRNIRQ